jgi:hypothetical protein
LPNLTLAVPLYSFGLSLKAWLRLALSSIWQFWIFFSYSPRKRDCKKIIFLQSLIIFQSRQSDFAPWFSR